MKRAMISASRRCAVVAVLAGSTLFSSQAWAVSEGDKQSIRALSNEAAADFERHRYEAAREKFQRAYAIAKVPKLAVWLARSHEKLGQLVSAYELYRQAANLETNELWQGNTQQQAKKDAESELERLEPRIPKLKISIEGAKIDEVSVKLDDTAIPSGLLGVERLVDPGEHDVVATHGEQTVREHVTLAERANQSVALHFNAPSTDSASGASEQAAPSEEHEALGSARASTAPSESDSESPVPRGKTQRTLGWIGVGVGGAAIVLGSVTGIMVANKYGTLKDKCPDGNCGPTESSDVDGYRTLRHVSTASFIAGGVLAAAGVTLILTSPRAEQGASAALWLTPNGGGIRGTF